MHSLTKRSYVVQGLDIHLLCESRLHLLLSNYFNSLYKGDKRLEIKPLEFELSIVEEPPSIPGNSVQAIKAPSITSYSNGKEIYFTSKDDSMVYLDPVLKKTKGFLRKEILSDSIELFSLVGAPVVETLKYHGLYFLHSAALYGHGMGCLVSGDGGCGKTTTSLSLVREGFQYVSDDSLFLEDLNGEIVVRPVYTNFHIDQDLAERFPEVAIRKNLPIPEGSKVSVDISRIFPGSFIPSLKPNVIISPQIVSSGKSRLHPLGRMEVYTRLLKQTVLAVDKEVSINQLKILEKLVKQTTGFELLGGREIYEDPKRIVSLLCKVSDQNENH